MMNPKAQHSTSKSLSTMESSQEITLNDSEAAATSNSTKPSHNPNAEDKKEATEKPNKIRKPRFKKIEYTYPVEPQVIQVVKKPKTYTDHSYRDFSQVPPEADYKHPTNIDEMTFSQKVFHMLSDDALSNWIHWLPHGRSFKIAVPKRLEQSQTLQRYFGHNRYSSFLRMLNNHGFKHITKGPDRNCYYHECMLRGMPHLTKYMPPGRDARRLMADPDNEPDFYAIDRLFPLAANGNNNNNNNSKQTLGNNPLLAGFGGKQQQQNPLLGGLGNFQQLPPGLLAMASTPQASTSTQNFVQQGAGMNQGTVIGNFLNQPRFGQMNNPVGNLMPLQQQQTMNDPKFLAALLQQQQVQQMQQPPSTQRAQSSFMRFT